MLTARIRVDGPLAGSVVSSLGPEAGRELPRTTVRIESEETSATVVIEASDTSAMRAALNSYLEGMRIVEDIESLREAHS
ncbi:MAG: hypothetical protein IJ810_01585 [Candidatus Methanomethylophilus sp.]|nr:hypothetical protein [Methanomethylophilus sp.]